MPPQLAAPPAASSNLVLAAPIDRQDEAIPLGNGPTGGLLWGGGHRVVLSLDRGDLWDLRTPEIPRKEDWTYATMCALREAGDREQLVELFERPYAGLPYPTKFPAGRLELELGEERQVQQFSLDLVRAEGVASLSTGRVEVFFDATDDVAMLRCPAGAAPVLRLVRPAVLDQLGYGPPSEGGDANSAWFVQENAEGGFYAVVAAWRDRRSRHEIAVAVAPASQAELALRDGRQRAARALDAGYDSLLLQHRAWWVRFWGSSNITIPDAGLQAHYEIVKYLHGAGSRSDAPPMARQGRWTADGGELPPQKGGYDNDFNTEMTYLACCAAGLEAASRSQLEWHWSLLPCYREFARSFYTVAGAVVPGATALDGQALGGWSQYALSPTNGAWIAHSFYLYWRYTVDAEFLAERAYPFCAEIGEALLGLLEDSSHGEGGGPLRLPLSTSPEYFDGTMRAWLAPDSNYDQALLQWLFGALAEMAHALKDELAAERWSAVRARLEPLDVDAAGSLSVARGVSYDTTHRHLSHVLAVYPLGLLQVEDADQKKLIDASLNRIVEKGPGAWKGFSFSWMACLLARAGRGDEALAYLETYQRAFLSRNGFHLGGDQSSEPVTSFRERAFSIEGNALAMQALQEMLLQSHGGLLRVFPACPERWPNAAFEQLRAEGGHRVSAVRLGGRTKSVVIVAGSGGVIRLRDPFEGGVIFWNADVVKSGDVYEIPVFKGETVSASVLVW